MSIKLAHGGRGLRDRIAVGKPNPRVVGAVLFCFMLTLSFFYYALTWAPFVFMWVFIAILGWLFILGSYRASNPPDSEGGVNSVD